MFDSLLIALNRNSDFLKSKQSRHSRQSTTYTFLWTDFGVMHALTKQVATFHFKSFNSYTKWLNHYSLLRRSPLLNKFPAMSNSQFQSKLWICLLLAICWNWKISCAAQDHVGLHHSEGTNIQSYFLKIVSKILLRSQFFDILFF
jgi:hypothetical protein